MAMPSAERAPTAGDALFAGSIPELYDSLLVPLIFDPCARDLAGRIAAMSPRRVLETAAGTGALTRALAHALPPQAELVATDLHAPMLARAREKGAAREVQWHAADALALPFGDATFDVVACQFGVMFFPDRVRGFAQARRVLQPGGTFAFNVWDRIEANDFAHTVTQSLARLYPADPPRFLARVPHGVHDLDALKRELAEAGFNAPVEVATVSARSRAGSAQMAALAYCQGTPLRAEIEARHGASLAEATAAAAAALARRFGHGVIEGETRAYVLLARC